MGQGQSNTGAATTSTQIRRRGSYPELAAANLRAVKARQPTNTGDSVMRSQLERAKKNGLEYQQRLEQERLARERLAREQEEQERLARERRTAKQERAALEATQGRVGTEFTTRNAGLIPPTRRTHKYKSRKNRSRKLRK
jgi:hypothetical protein